MIDTTRVVTEAQSDGTTVLRYKLDKFYDSNSIEGRTGQRAAEMIGTRYDAVIIAANRIRELNRGDAARIERRYGNRVTAIQEIEAGLVGYELFGKVYKNSYRRDRDGK
jgi:DNA-directed RNA polymerase omega subunit